MSGKGGEGKQKLPLKSTPVQPLQGKLQPVKPILQTRNQAAVTQHTDSTKKVSNQSNRGNMPENAKNMPATANVKNMPATANAKNMPATANVKNMPATANVKNIPATANVKNMPATANVKNMPATANVKNMSATANVKNMPATANVKNIPANANVKNMPATANVKNMPANGKSQVKSGNIVQSQSKPGNNAQPGSLRGQVKPKQDVTGVQKRSFISEQEIATMLGGSEMDDNNNNIREVGSQDSLNQVGAACLVNIAKVYSAQQRGFDKLDGSKLVEDVLLKGKFWRDTLSAAEERKDSINVYGLKVVFHSPNMIEMSKKRFFACIHLHNALRNFGIRSALAVHIDITGIRHKKVSEIAHRIVQLVGDGYNFFALQFKLIQTSDPMKRLFNEPGAFGIYIGFAFILDYLAYRNKCKKHNMAIEYDIKKYVEVLGDEGYVVRGIDKSAGSSMFEFEVTQEAEDLHLEYVEHLFNGVRFTA